MKTPCGTSTAGKGAVAPYALRSKKTLSFVTPNGRSDGLDSGRKRKVSEPDVFSPTCKTNKTSTSRELRLASKDLQECIIVCASPDISPMKAFRSSGLAVEIVDAGGARRSVLVGEGWLIEDLISDVCGTDYDLSQKVVLSDCSGRTLERSQNASELSRLETYYMSC